MYSLIIAFSSAGEKPFSVATVEDPELLLTTSRPASRSSSVPQFRLLAFRWGLGVAGPCQMAMTSGASEPKIYNVKKRASWAAIPLSSDDTPSERLPADDPRAMRWYDSASPRFLVASANQRT
jgi:hypothetical protein